MATDAGGSLDRYQLKDGDLLGFIPVSENIRPNTYESEQILAYPEGSGVYYWIMRYEGNRFKIYVGRTTSLRRRLREYSNRFQPGVPNDYKMRHFERWMRDRFPDAQLELHFYKSDDPVRQEKRILSATRPFINERPAPDPAALRDSAALEHANWEYYRNRFDRQCIGKLDV
jgi:hypothetical protein